MDNKIGENIKKNRLSKNFTQKRLGEMLDFSASAVSSWEKNRTEPDYETIKQMVQIFGLSSMDELCGKSTNNNCHEIPSSYSINTFTKTKLYTPVNIRNKIVRKIIAISSFILSIFSYIFVNIDLLVFAIIGLIIYMITDIIQSFIDKKHNKESINYNSEWELSFIHECDNNIIMKFRSSIILYIIFNFLLFVFSFTLVNRMLYEVLYDKNSSTFVYIFVFIKFLYYIYLLIVEIIYKQTKKSAFSDLNISFNIKRYGTLVILNLFYYIFVCLNTVFYNSDISAMNLKDITLVSLVINFIFSYLINLINFKFYSKYKLYLININTNEKIIIK